MLRKVLLGGTFLALLSFASCGGGHYFVGASIGPPAPLVENPFGVAPGPDYIWTPGFYDWTGGNWAWRRGDWRRPPHRGDRWEPRHWEHRGNGYRRSGGRWQRGGHSHH